MAGIVHQVRLRVAIHLARAEARPLDPKGWIILGAVVVVLGYFAIMGNPIPGDGWRSLKLDGWAAHLGYGFLASVPAYVLALHVVARQRHRP